MLKKFFIDFFENFIPCILTIYSSLSQLFLDPPHFPTHPTNSIFLFKKNPNWAKLMLLIYSWMYGLHWIVVALLLLKTDSPSASNYQLPKAPQLGVRLHAHLFSSCWDLSGLNWGFKDLLCVITTTMNSYVQILWCVPKTIFWSPSPLLALTIFPPLLFSGPWALGRKEVI